MITNFKDLMTNAIKVEGVVTGVPCAEDDFTVSTVIEAKKISMSDFILTGNKKLIIDKIKELGGEPNDFEIVDTENPMAASAYLVKLAREKKVHVLLKGYLSTAELLKPTLDKEKGLRTGNLFSDILVCQNPCKKGFLGIADGGINIAPDLEQKIQIIENSIKVYHNLGYDNPKVGIMTAKESVNEKMQSTIDAQKLTEMNAKGEIKDCLVYGPLALDIAVSQEAALHKGIDNEVAGDVDIMIMPSIEAGNLLGKSITYFLKQPVGHVVMGATIPILIPSRNEGKEDKLNSLSLGVLVGGN